MHKRPLIIAALSVLFPPILARGQPPPPPNLGGHAYVPANRPGSDPLALTRVLRPEAPPILAVLERDLTGQPVIAVGTFWPEIDIAKIVIRKSAKLLPQVQDVADAFSTPELQCVPYAVRGAWVLAPGKRVQVNTDYSNLTPIDISGRARLLTEVVARLSPREQDLVCSPGGVPAGTLDATLQTMVARAVRPPLHIISARPRKDYPADSEEVPGESYDMSGTPDLRRVRLRVQLRSSVPCVLDTIRESESYSHTEAYEIGQAPAVARREIQAVGDYSGFYDGGTDLPALLTVDNTFKPSDLDGKTLRQPFGAHGVISVADVMKRLEEATRLKFRASAQYSTQRAFIGADTVTCGEVTDGLRLALTASWRHIGDVYFLTWDRTGLGALQITALEKAQDLTHASDKAASDAGQSESWLDLAQKIPFAPDDRFAWTAGQRQTLFGTRPGDQYGNTKPQFVWWQDLRPVQQNAIRALALGRKVNMPDPASPTREWRERELTEQDLSSIGFKAQANIELCVDLGDGVWVAVGDWWRKTLDGDSLESTRRQAKYRADEEKRKAEAAAHPGAPMRATPYRQPERSLFPARKRALIAPVLTPDRLAKLASLMRARGFDTLFYPILSNGYATFPSKAFPLDPAVRSPNGWATCVSLMKSAGVKVIGVMEVLSWRRPGEKGHWIEKHPDWLDVDILGRPYSEHLRAESQRLLTPLPDVTGDVVRADEPQVTSRLDTLLAEFMREPGSSGLCLDAWNLQTAARWKAGNSYMSFRDGRSVGPMGCAVPDRLKSILDNGVDPVDVQQSGGFTPPSYAASYISTGYTSGGNVWFADGTSSTTANRAVSAYVSLATRLLPKKRPDGAPWTTYAVAETPPNGYAIDNGATTNPPASVLLRAPLPYYRPNESPTIIVRVPDKSQRKAMAANYGVGSGQPAMVAAEGGSMTSGMARVVDLAVYDFRGAPDELEDSLRRVGIPEDVVDGPAAVSH